MVVRRPPAHVWRLLTPLAIRAAVLPPLTTAHGHDTSGLKHYSPLSMYCDVD